MMLHNILPILERDSEVTVVCFDFFDTLVYRLVEPEHTKRIAAKQLSLLFKGHCSSQNIYQHRFELEAALCRQNAESGKDLEFRIPDFALEFFELLRQNVSEFPTLMEKDYFQKIFLRIEMQVEKSVQRLFSETIDILKTIRNRGYKTGIISDFYFPSPLFRELLAYHRLSGLVDYLFISCDYGISKGSGRLYQRVFQQMAHAPRKILMVGDNGHSDVHMAKAAGWKALHVDRAQQKSFYAKWAKEQEYPDRIKKQLEGSIADAVRRKGGSQFPEMSLSLWNFTHKLFQQLIQDNVQNVFFFSKEGEFLKKLFDTYQQEQFGLILIRSHYLLVSRKATYVCSLKPLMEENFARLFYQYREISCRDFLLSLNFHEEEARAWCDRLGLDFEKRLPRFDSSDSFLRLVSDRVFAHRYEEHRQYQKNNLLRYLHSFGVDFRREGVNIVDVGWKGSIQDNLFFVFGQEVPLNGYYLGLLQPTNTNDQNRKTGILFSDTPFETPYLPVYNSNRSLFEMLLTATHGSADGYFIRDQSSKSQNGDFSKECDKCYMECNGIKVRTLDLFEERALFDKTIGPLQDRFADTIVELLRLSRISMASFPGNDWFAWHHARMMFDPSPKEIAFFESLYHLENFGIFEFTRFNVDSKLSAQEIQSNRNALREDPESVYQVGIWAPVLLKRMGLQRQIGWYGRYWYRKLFAERLPWWKRIDWEWLRIVLHRVRPKSRIRIAFFLGTPDINGGTYVIFEHACRLKKRGYRVVILTKNAIDPERYAWHPDAEQLEWITYDEANGVDFDFAVATWWYSTYLLNQVEASTYFYFVQSIETLFYPPDHQCTHEERVGKQLADRTYHFSLPIITEARWIKNYLKDNYGHDAWVVPNGIRKDIYTEEGERYGDRSAGRLRVLVEGPLNVAYKNVEQTIALCQASNADEIWLLTSSDVDVYPGVHRVFSKVPVQETPAIYRSCDVLVKLSYVEGMFGPPLEMFHCGGTAVVYNVTGHDEYIRHGENALVVETDDEKAVVASLNRLRQDPEFLALLKEGAARTAQQWPDWDTVSKKFENALRRSYGRYRVNRSYLDRIAGQFRQFAHEKVEQSDVLATYRGQGPTSQYCQIYWDFGNGLSEAESEKLEYESGRWSLVRMSLEVPSGTVGLRIDPSLEAGVGWLDQIAIRDPQNGILMFTASKENRWEDIEIGGTADLIEDRDGPFLKIRAYGEDPQFLLSPLKIGAESRTIEIEVTVKFLPFPLAVGDLLQSVGHRLDGSSISLNEATIDRH